MMYPRNQLVFYREEQDFQFEVLKARLAIKDFFFEYCTREIYENVGQLLSVVKMQIESAYSIKENDAVIDLSKTGELLGHSIRELRLVAKSFRPDEILLGSTGLKDQLLLLSSIILNKESLEVDESFKEEHMDDNFKLLVFNLILQILLSINQTDFIVERVGIACNKNIFVFSLMCKAPKSEVRVGFNEHVVRLITLMNGLQTQNKTKDGIVTMLLKIPLI